MQQIIYQFIKPVANIIEERQFTNIIFIRIIKEKC